VRAAAVECLGPLREKGGGDFVEEFSAIVPMNVIMELVGVPAADRNQPIHLTDPRLEKAGRCRIPHLDSPARWDNEPGQPSGRGMRPAGAPVRLERRRARGGAAGGDDSFASPGAVPVRRAERP